MGGSDAASDMALVRLLHAAAEPGGMVTADAFGRITVALCDRLAASGDVDAVYLDLPGTMVTEEYEDGEAKVLRRGRAVVGADLPIAVSLDLHGNLSPEFARLASYMIMYRTYPYIDMGVVGGRAAHLLMELLERGMPFATAFRQLDYIIPITAQSTRRQPAARFYGMPDGLVEQGVSSVAFDFGFPPADIYNCGTSVYACGSNQDAVDTAADEMLAALQDAGDSFDTGLVPAAVRRAMEVNGSKLVVLADPQGNPGAGAPGDASGLPAAMPVALSA